MIQNFKKFSKLSLLEKKLFLEAWLMLGVVRAAILTISFKRLTRSLEHYQHSVQVIPLNDCDIQNAVTIGRLVANAANNTPWESACLAQSLTAQRMLKKRGIPGVFYLGVMKDKENDKNVRAHAWSQCDETIITGAKGHENYKVVSVYRW